MVPNGRTGLIEFNGEKWSILGGGLLGSLQTIHFAGRKWYASGHFGRLRRLGTEANGGAVERTSLDEFGNELYVAQSDSENYVRSFSHPRWIDLRGWSFFRFRQRRSSPEQQHLDGHWRTLGGIGQALAFYRGELFAGHSSGIARWTGNGWTNVGDGLNGGSRRAARAGRCLVCRWPIHQFRRNTREQHRPLGRHKLVGARGRREWCDQRHGWLAE